MKNTLIITILFLLTFNSGIAQFVNFGQDRASLRWKQINTNDFQLIYPDFFEENAQKIANIYQQLYQHANTLQHKPKKISVILHANGGVSNGNVAWAPKKSELYTMPSQDPTDSWLQHLCIHEFRHVIQIDKINQGLTHSLYYIFGEIFPIAVLGVYVPMWFMEGDAVCYETSVGYLGRGRSPEFLNEMKAQIVEKGIYSFYKAILGSYKDYVPNRYNMGYFMTANARANYGPDIWAKALERTGRRPFGFTPFAKSLKITMQGKRDSLWNDSTFRSLFINPDSVRKANTYADAKRTLYRDNFSELQQIWKREPFSPQLFDTLFTKNKYYSNYYYPTSTQKGKTIAYKTGLAQTGAFVELNGKSEKLLVRTGLLDDQKFAFNRQRLLWSEYCYHPRWEQGGRMQLNSYDLKHKKYRRYKRPYNCFAPFTAGHQWGYVEVNDQNQSSIVLLDSALQQETWRLTGKDNELFIHPSYHNGHIITVVQNTQGLHLENIDLATHTRTPITKNLYYELDNPIVKNDSVYYRASYNGNNALYRQAIALSPSVNILNSRYGIRFPSFNLTQDTLLFSFYTSDGYKPGRIPLSSLQDRPVITKQYRLADTVTLQENWHLDPTADSVYTSRKYNKFTHLVNIHSWGPLAVDLNDEEVDLGAVIYSQNKLSTLSFTFGYIHQSGYDHGAWLLNATYSGWWPVIQLNFKSGKEKLIVPFQLQLPNNQTLALKADIKSQFTSADLIVRFPFNISRKQYNRSLQPYVRYKMEARHNNRITSLNTDLLSPKDLKLDFPNQIYQISEYGLSFNNQTRMTEQEINPRWGQILSLGFTHTPMGKNRLGNQWWTDGKFYFPGIALNHSFAVYGGFQQMSDKQRSFSNKIFSPRGIKLYGYEIASMRCNYRLPLLYPDLNISSILYIKGIDGCLFYDMGTEKREKIPTKTFSSYGIELTADTHVFRLTFPIHVGFRTGYENKTKNMFADLIFSIGLSI